MDEEAIFLEALRLTTAAARAAYLDAACAGNVTLRQGVEELLQAHEQAGAFLEGKASGLLPPQIQGTSDGVGKRVGPYKLLQVIGEGGMGVVYMAEQTEPEHRRVALKIVKPGMDTRQMVARFEAERHALALMDHPHIAKVFDGGKTDTGQSYFAMELVKGVPITRFCDDQRLATAARLELFVAVCQAVQHAHQKGIIHRDLKPSNILVALVDGHPVPKVIDFGVAKATGQRLTDVTMFTEFGQIVGTLEYMSPEQARLDQLDIDTRSDIYSLGVLLYELLAGSPPFSVTQLKNLAFDEMLRIVREVTPPKPSHRLSSSDRLPAIAAVRGLEPHRLKKLVAGELDWIVMKCLEKERGLRYATANGLAADVERYLRNEPVVAGPPSTLYRFRKFTRRHRTMIIVTALVGVSLIAGLTGTTWQFFRVRRAEQAALGAERRAADEAAAAKAVNQFLQEDLLGMAGASQQLRAGLRPTPDLKLATLLDRALANVATRFAGQPREKSEVQDTLGKSLLSIGRYEEAATMFEQVRSYREQALGTAAPETLTAMHNLAEAYRQCGRFDMAIALGQQTVTAQRRVLGLEHPDTLCSMGSLANSYVAVGRVEEAIALHEQTLRLMRRVLGADHGDTLAALGSLAEAYRAAGQSSKSLALHEESLELTRSHYGPEHPEVLTAMNNLALAVAQAGQPDKAISLLEPMIAQARTSLGPEHHDTLLAMNNLAGMYRETGRYAESLALQDELVPLMRKVLGPHHPDTMLTVGSLANTYVEAGLTDKAIDLLEQLLRQRREILGPEHPDTVLTMDNLAHAYGSANQFDKALPLQEQALELQRKVLGPSHPDTLRTMSNLGFTLWYTRQLDRAVAVLEETVKLQSAVLPGDHPDIVRAKAHLGRACRDAGRVDEAIVLLEEANRKMGSQSAYRWIADELLQTYVLAGKSTQAEALAGNLLAEDRAQLPPDSLPLAGACSRTAQSLLRLKAWDAAELPLRESLAIRQQQAPEDWRTFNTQSMLGEVLVGKHRFADAEPHLIQSLEGLRQRADQIPADSQARVSEALERLVQLYEAWEKPEEAAKWRAELSTRRADN